MAVGFSTAAVSSAHAVLGGLRSSGYHFAGVGFKGAGHYVNLSKLAPGASFTQLVMLAGRYNTRKHPPTLA